MVLYVEPVLIAWLLEYLSAAPSFFVAVFSGRLPELFISLGAASAMTMLTIKITIAVSTIVKPRVFEKRVLIAG